MHPNARLTSRDRQRALQRLRWLTAGTAVAGLVAVGGFGYLAAVSYPGHSSTTSSAATSGSAVAGSIQAPSFQAAPGYPSVGGGTAQVTTGGSR